MVTEEAVCRISSVDSDTEYARTLREHTVTSPGDCRCALNPTDRKHLETHRTCVLDDTVVEKDDLLFMSELQITIIVNSTTNT